MNYGELINKIRDLGFLEDSEMEEYGEVVPHAINQAIDQISSEIAPIIDKYEFEITDTTTGYLYIDMTDMADDFLDFGETPVLFEEEGSAVFKKWNDYEIEMGHNIVINADNNKGKFRIYYKRQHVPFTIATPLETEIEVPLKAQFLIPLLSAYYVLLEDDPTKAAYYYNQFETYAAQIMSQSNRPRGRIVTSDDPILTNIREWGVE